MMGKDIRNSMFTIIALVCLTIVLIIVHIQPKLPENKIIMAEFKERVQEATLPQFSLRPWPLEDHPHPLFQVPAQDFQKIGNRSELKLYVYSAYFDNSSSTLGSVNVLAALTTTYSHKLFCLFFDKRGQYDFIANGALKALHSDNFMNLPYVPYVITCKTMNKDPTFVSIVEPGDTDKRLANSTNILRIQYQKNNDLKYNFALCVQPTYNYDKPLEFAEWIEFYKLMGVERFTFYNHSIGPNTSCLMKTYEQIEILPWSCPYEPEKEIRLYAQFLANHDCLQRYKGIAKYLVIVDLDEMIMPAPQFGNNFSQMISKVNEDTIKGREFVAGYSFRNGFFVDEWDSDRGNFSNGTVNDFVITKNHSYKLKISKRILRKQKMEKHRQRSKLIIVPDKVQFVGCHAVVETIGNSKVIPVSPDTAYLHHYRDSESPTADSKVSETKDTVIDNTGLRFASAIADQIDKKLKTNAKNCNI